MRNETQQPDFEKLRVILEQQLDREVTLTEAIGAGNCLINIYEVLLYDESNNGKLSLDTTNR